MDGKIKTIEISIKCNEKTYYVAYLIELEILRVFKNEELVLSESNVNINEASTIIASLIKNVLYHEKN